MVPREREQTDPSSRSGPSFRDERRGWDPHEQTNPIPEPGHRFADLFKDRHRRGRPMNKRIIPPEHWIPGAGVRLAWRSRTNEPVPRNLATDSPIRHPTVPRQQRWDGREKTNPFPELAADLPIRRPPCRDDNGGTVANKRTRSPNLATDSPDPGQRAGQQQWGCSRRNKPIFDPGHRLAAPGSTVPEQWCGRLRRRKHEELASFCKMASGLIFQSIGCGLCLLVSIVNPRTKESATGGRVSN